MEKTVSFTGHRPNKFSHDGTFRNLDHELIAWVKSELYVAIFDAIDQGYRHFIYGGAIGVDMWAGEIVADLREFFPNITLTLYKPFEGQESRWTSQDIQAYRRLVSRCDSVKTICEGGYEAYKMIVRDKAMVDDSQLLIAVWNGDGGRSGTGHTVNYALKVGRPIWHINPQTREERRQIGRVS